MATAPSDLQEMRLEAEHLPLAKARVMRAMGGGGEGGNGEAAAGSAAMEAVRGLVDTCADVARSRIAACMAWCVRPARLAGGELEIGGAEGAVLRVGKTIAAQLTGLEAAAVFVVTIGDTLELEARERMRQDVLQGYVLDAYGSVAVEEAADRLEIWLKHTVAIRRWTITNRYSPGYCSWPTEDQHALFGILGESPAGVTLSDSALMSPIKSVSGVIGLGANVKYRPYPCDLCGMEKCRQRLTESRT